MTYLRLLNIQGIAGIAGSVCLALLLVIQKGDTRHWRKQSGQFEQLYRGEQASFAGTVANYRAAAERVRTEQAAINQRSNHDLQARLADARANADRLRQLAESPAHSGPRGGALVPGLPASASRADQAAGQDRLPLAEALIATEQAIQLDELIGWVRRQHSVNPSAAPQPAH